MTSLLVSWDPPKKRNGELIGYIVTYETAEQNERELPSLSLLVLYIKPEYSKL